MADEPTFEQALAWMRSSDPEVQEDGFYFAQRVAAAHVDELIEAFAAESDRGLRCWLLELLGDAKSERAYDLFAAQLQSPDESLQFWAMQGLNALDTPEALRLLGEAKHWQLSTAAETEFFRRQLAETQNPELRRRSSSSTVEMPTDSE